MKRNAGYEKTRWKKNRNCTMGIFQIAAGSPSTNMADNKKK
jgi:hypothetical protein